MQTLCLWALVVASLFFSTPTQAADSAVVTAARAGVNGDRTRIVLESDAPIKYTFFTLPNPNRVVLDLRNTSFATDLRKVKVHENALIKSMRQGLFKKGVTRMVLDAKKSVKASVFIIPNSKNAGARLVIDVYPRKAGDKETRHVKVVPPKKPVAVKSPIRKEEKALAPVVRPAAKQKKKKDAVVIVIDPGHGGVDPGAIGKYKTREKDVVFNMAKRLRKHLQKIPNTKVYLTREKDIFVKLRDRVSFAQRRNADLFISIHADAHSDRRVSGGSVYVLSERSSDKEAARLARHVNEGDIIAGIDFTNEPPEVRNILLDLTQRETLNKSSLLAQEVIKDMRKVIKVRNKQRPLFAGFRVLKAPEIPSILVEMAYISNPKEEKNLKSWRHQEKLATAITRGVRRFVDSHLR